MKFFRRTLPLSISCFLIAALFTVTPMPFTQASAQVSDSLNRAVETYPDKVIDVGAGLLVLKKSSPRGFDFEITDREQKQVTLASGSVTFSEKSLNFNLREQDGTTSKLKMKRRGDDVIVDLSYGDSSTSMRIANAGTRNAALVNVSVDADQYKAYVQAVSKSSALRVLRGFFAADSAAAGEDGAARTLSRLTQIATGSLAAPGRVHTASDSIGGCGLLAEVNFSQCMRGGGDGVTCWWDSVVFFVICLL